MTHPKILVAALLAGLCAPALADEAPATPPPDQPGSPRPAMAFHFDTARIDQKTGAMTMHMNAIRNAPYSAEVVTERLQNLGDGNQIAERRTTMRYRDSAGRTREESRGENGEMVVTIDDPVAGQNLMLRPQDRTAVKIRTPGDEARIAAEAGREAARAAREQVEQMRKDGSLPTVERHKLADGSEEIIVKRVERVDAQARARLRQDVRIQASQALAANAAAMRSLQARLAPLTASAFGDMRWSQQASTRDLGTREFDGVKAEGKLRSYEIPAGAIGNRKPIVVSDESWYAPDLRVTVYTRHSDPRSGDFIFRLDKLKREEPPAALFSVPADYTVTDPLAQVKPRSAAGAR